MDKTTSPTGVDFIKGFEKLRLTSYCDPGGVWTIGYGHTGANIKQGLTITEDAARVFLKADLGVAEKAVNSKVKVPLTQNQFDALVSFVFNIGINAFATSSVLAYINVKDFNRASESFLLFNKIHDFATKKLKVSAGLNNRRLAEQALFKAAK